MSYIILPIISILAVSTLLYTYKFKDEIDLCENNLFDSIPILTRQNAGL
jgi:hypothetical protein